MILKKISRLDWICLALGLLVLGTYWYSIHPMDFARGYTEDWCHPDITRQLMSEAIEQKGGPDFHTLQYLAPYGLWVPFMSWGIEVSWLGSYFFKWSRDFPFYWALFAWSLLVSYLGVGAILRQMGLKPRGAWGLALAVVLLHVPRHFKIWHHFEHLLQHWVYLSFFLDAWIWQRFARDRKWSWSLEAWRGLCLLGMMTTAGYFWGVLLLEWLLVRGCMGWVLAYERARGRKRKIQVEGSWRVALPTVFVGLLLVALELRWFLPLSRAVAKLGAVPTAMGWFGHWPYMLRPLWLDDLSGVWAAAFGRPLVKNGYAVFETVITPGWFWLVPVICGLVAVRRAGKSALLTVLPFALLFVIAVDYFNSDPPGLAVWVQRIVPFMSFFRVTTRWGLMWPAMFGVMVALCWPQLSAWTQRVWRGRRSRVWLAVFVASTAMEMSHLGKPVSTMPELDKSAQRLLEGVRRTPGSAVLDMPFCLSGGNGVCTQQQCPNYPDSTSGGCFRGWHDKAVYGIYASRLVFGHCDYYNQQPYLSWFDAWRTQRCLTPEEWDGFCHYLDTQDLAAVLLYPDIWRGAGTPECLAQFEARLGPARDQAEFAVAAIRGKETPRMSRLMWFGGKCVRR